MSNLLLVLYNNLHLSTGTAKLWVNIILSFNYILEALLLTSVPPFFYNCWLVKGVNERRELIAAQRLLAGSNEDQASSIWHNSMA